MHKLIAHFHAVGRDHWDALGIGGQQNSDDILMLMEWAEILLLVMERILILFDIPFYV